MNKYFILIIFSLFLTSSVFAQTVLTDDVKKEISDIKQNERQDIIDTKKDVKKQAIDVKQNIRDKAVEIKQNIKQEITQKRTEVVEQIKQKREEFKATIEQKRIEFKNQLEVRREEVKTAIEIKQQELKKRLKNIKDERKKQTVERIDNRIDELNERMTGHFSEVLEHFEKVLENINSRADKAITANIDVSAVKTAIIEAQDAINISRAAIETQAGKTYKIVITTETGLRQDVGIVRQKFHDDIVGVRDTVFAVKEDIRKAATILAQIPKVDEVDLNQPATSTISETATGTEQ